MSVDDIVKRIEALRLRHNKGWLEALSRRTNALRDGDYKEADLEMVWINAHLEIHMELDTLLDKIRDGAGGEA